jgi:hypothetical protein
VQRDTDDADAHRDGHRRQGDPDAQRRTHRFPARGEPTLGEDQHQRSPTDRLGERGVGELDAQHRLPEQDPDPEVEQQRGQPDPHRDPHGEHPEQHHGGHDTERDLQARHAHLRPLHGIGAGRGPRMGDEQC